MIAIVLRMSKNINSNKNLIDPFVYKLFICYNQNNLCLSLTAICDRYMLIPLLAVGDRVQNIGKIIRLTVFVKCTE